MNSNAKLTLKGGALLSPCGSIGVTGSCKQMIIAPPHINGFVLQVHILITWGRNIFLISSFCSGSWWSQISLLSAVGSWGWWASTWTCRVSKSGLKLALWERPRWVFLSLMFIHSSPPACSGHGSPLCWSWSQLQADNHQTPVGKFRDAN